MSDDIDESSAGPGEIGIRPRQQFEMASLKFRQSSFYTP